MKQVRKFNKKEVISVILILVVLGFFIYYALKPEPRDEENRNYCTEEQKQADACIEIYQPVCGYSDPEKIQCIRAPCASTYSNSCFACQGEDVLYWVDGVCE